MEKEPEVILATDINGTTFEVGRQVQWGDELRPYCKTCDHNPCECKVSEPEVILDRNETREERIHRDRAWIDHLQNAIDRAVGLTSAQSRALAESWDEIFMSAEEEELACQEDPEGHCGHVAKEAWESLRARNR